MIRLFTQGGLVMWPLLAFSIATLAVVVERLLFWNSIRENSERLLSHISKLSMNDFGIDLYSRFKDQNGPVGYIIKQFMAFIGSFSAQGNINRKMVEEYLRKSGQEYVRQMERKLKVLEVAASVSPLLGLLGTVTGIMKSFNVLSIAQGVSRPEMISVGIAEALITTAFGLIIAVVAMVAYSYFSHRIENSVAIMDKAIGELMIIVDYSNSSSSYRV